VSCATGTWVSGNMGEGTSFQLFISILLLNKGQSCGFSNINTAKTLSRCT
jgi:hypothetical protein